MPHDSYRRLEEAIRNFTEDSNPGAMLLHGEWGVGKTHACLAVLKDQNEEQQQPYSYVSLYGISTIDQIYMLVAMGCLNKAAKNLPPFMNKFLNKGGGLAQFIGAITGKGNNIAAASITTIGLLARDMIVVIDDLERRDKKLTIEAALGVVSYLVEVGKCQVILITNDDEFIDEEKITFNRQKEKAFDREVFYSPSIEENVKIFGGKNSDILLPPLKGLNTRNLRVIKRVSARLAEIRAKLPSDCPSASATILRNAAVLGVLHFGFRATADLDTRKTASYLQMLHLMDDSALELSGSDKQFIAAGFEEGPADKEIIEIYRTGMTDWEALAQKLKEYEERADIEKIVSVINTAIKACYSNYSTSESEIVEILLTNCGKNAEFIDPNLLECAGQILENLGHAGETKKWLDRWASANITSLSNDEIQEILDRVQPFSKALLPLVEQERDKRIGKPSLQKELNRRFSDGIFSPEIMAKLAALPAADYLDWLENSASSSVRSIVKGIFKEFYGKTAPEGEIAEKTLAAINELATKSLLNQLRAKIYKQALPKDDSENSV